MYKVHVLGFGYLAVDRVDILTLIWFILIVSDRQQRNKNVYIMSEGKKHHRKLKQVEKESRYNVGQRMLQFK